MFNFSLLPTPGIRATVWVSLHAPQHSGQVVQSGYIRFRCWMNFELFNNIGCWVWCVISVGKEGDSSTARYNAFTTFFNGWLLYNLHLPPAFSWEGYLDLSWTGVCRLSLKAPTHLQGWFWQKRGPFFKNLAIFGVFALRKPANLGSVRKVDPCLRILW